MIVDLFLRAGDRTEMDSALEQAGLIGPEGRLIDPEGVRLSRIGRIARPTGEIDGGGMQIMEDVPGYHANLRVQRALSEAELAALAPVTIDPPASPYRVWFG